MTSMGRRARAPASPAEVSGPTPWDLSQPPRIPVARPRLAPVEAALPYLRAIDGSRTYSNFGPLNTRFEERLAERMGLQAGCVVTCCNATAGLTATLQSVARPGAPYCVMPAWTFAATGHAALAAGLTPFLTDVDPVTGALTPELAEAAIRRAPGQIAAILPVAPFGRPLDPAAWDRFEENSGVPVVIDAAAGFDALSAGRAPAVVSLHATKVLGIGEGGFVVSREPSLVAEVRRRINFGFDGSREATVAGANGKLSEHGAAFGHAALDTWPLQRLQFQAVLRYYRAALIDASELRIAEGLGETWVCSTFNIEGPPAAVSRAEHLLAQADIATRRWWGLGLHRHPAFAKTPSMALPVTDELARRTLGLPCWPGISEAELDEIAAIVRGAFS